MTTHSQLPCVKILDTGGVKYTGWANINTLQSNGHAWCERQSAVTMYTADHTKRHTTFYLLNDRQNDQLRTLQHVLLNMFFACTSGQAPAEQ